MAQQWHDLVVCALAGLPQNFFAAHIPLGLEIDTFEGAAWLAIVPFRMGGRSAAICARLTRALQASLN